MTTVTGTQDRLAAFSFEPNGEHHTQVMDEIVALRLEQLRKLSPIARRITIAQSDAIAELLHRLPLLPESARASLTREPFFHASFTGLVTALRMGDQVSARRSLQRLLAAVLPNAAPLLESSLVLPAGPRGTIGFGSADPRLVLGFGYAGAPVTFRCSEDGALAWSTHNGRQGTIRPGSSQLIFDGEDERMAPMLEELAKDPHSFSTECVVPVTATGHLRGRLDQALERLASCWPTMHQEIKANVGLVVPIASQRTAAFSNTAWQGAVFLRDDFIDPLFLIERLVHESSHLRLNAVMVGTPMHEHAWNERVESPFRAGPRPVAGLLHGVFVFTRSALALLRTTDGTAEAQRGAAQARALIRKVTVALATLNSSVRLTEQGRELVAQTTQVCEDVEAACGDVAPAPESDYLQGEM